LDEEDPRKCRPTRITVEVCSSDLEEGCTTRQGIHDLLAELDVYDDYVTRLRGEKVLEDPE
jgi:hypothetical protein